jgi:hypothetical protein
VFHISDFKQNQNQSLKPHKHTQKEGFTYIYIYIYIYRERERERERERGCYSRRGHSRDFEIVVFEGAEEKGVDGRGGGG